MNTQNNKQRCPLCLSANTKHYHQDQERIYLNCPVCNLVFVPEQYFLSETEEKTRYNSHQNSEHDPKYRNFLNRLFQPLNNKLTANSYGLDFGSGPGPTLSKMFEQRGHKVDIYDYFYANNPEVFNNLYDFITASEVVEHLHHPNSTFAKLWKILKPQGWLGIMTKLVIDEQAFANWHYKRDPTHVMFYSKKSFEFMAHNWNAQLLFMNNDVILFQKMSGI